MQISFVENSWFLFDCVAGMDGEYLCFVQEKRNEGFNGYRGRYKRAFGASALSTWTSWVQARTLEPYGELKEAAWNGARNYFNEK